MYDFLGGVDNHYPLKSDLVAGHNNGCCGLSPCFVPSIVDVVSLLSIVALGCNDLLIGLFCRLGCRHLHVPQNSRQA